ncbi:MAG: transglutaminase-like domain-containing protein [Chloroflexota bacterium]
MKSKTPSPDLTTRWWDWFAAALLVLAIFTAVLRLAATKWTPELPVVQVVALLGVVLGLALGYSRFSGLLSFGLAWAYGLFIVAWQISSKSPGSLSWAERFLHVGERVQNVLHQIATGDVITDSVIFIIFMSVLFWLLSASAGYRLSRHGSSWQAFLPTGIVLFVIHFYHNCPYSDGVNVCNSPGLLVGASYLGSFLLFVLLLIGRTTYLQRLSDWKRRQVFVAPEVGFDLTRFIVILTLVTMSLAWFAPVAYAKSVPIANKIWIAAGTPVRKINDVLSPLFESVRTAVSVETDDFGPNLELGRGGVLTDRVTMLVEVKGAIIPSLPFYWRNRVYDYYENGGWQTTITDTLQTLDSTIPFSSTIKGSEMSFTFQPAKGLSVLYTPTRVTRVDIPIEVEGQADAGRLVDVTAIRPVELVRPNQGYQIKAQNYPVTILQLRQAGSEYPAWIAEHYLQLPNTITERTHALARQIAEGQETPYDIAAAVTLYLRENLTYTEVIPQPPAGQEPLDWILFDHKEAFCNYYASAEIVLLRSLGVPARLVVGYAQGQRQVNPNENLPPPEAGIQALASAPGLYTVRSRDAHAWVEVYFPGIGWVEFEPTVSQSAIVRPSGDSSINIVPGYAEPVRELPVMDEGEPTPEPFDRWEDLRKKQTRPAWWMAWGPAILLGGTLLALIVWHGTLLVKLEAFLRQQGKQPPKWLSRWVERIRNGKPFIVRFVAWLQKIGLRPPGFLRDWAIWADLTPIERAYAEVNRALVRLGHPPAVEDTPAERLTQLAELLPETYESCRRLLTEYQTATYSQHTAHPAIARWAAERIQKQSLKARLRQPLWQKS